MQPEPQLRRLGAQQRPFEQFEVGSMHSAPQPPQLSSSVCVLTQAPSQQMVPPEQPVPQASQFIGPMAVHAPSQQREPAAQAIPQPPQLRSSIAVQTPPQQRSLAPQVAPHAPQCWGSPSVSTHAPEQHVSSASHPPGHPHAESPGARHTPLQHAASPPSPNGAQAVPQPVVGLAPQWLTERAPSTHTPPQQVWPGSHELLHVPQFASSCITSTQSLLQHVSLRLHWVPQAPHARGSDVVLVHS